ncbi:MAG: prepilin peptidase [Candidatus Omnitrophica bacterium]|nr:prepilin peptidase [Candidatus Omnitrophota bacterium]
MFEKICVFIFGSITGSFLNVCIYRLPREESIVFPGSHCPKCNKPIFWFDNIPLLSYILLLGKCRFCKEKISPRYFLVELLTAGMFLLFYLCFGFDFKFFLYVILTCGLIVSTFVDFSHRIIPDEISIGGTVVGLCLNALVGVSFKSFAYNYHPLLNSLLGILVGGGIIYSTGLLFDLVFFKLLKHPPIQGETESMGGGDVKLLAMIGAFLGWKAALITFFVAPFFGMAVGLVNMIVKKDHLIPYGPFLSLAALLAIFWEQKILHILFLQ